MLLHIVPFTPNPYWVDKAGLEPALSRLQSRTMRDSTIGAICPFACNEYWQITDSFSSNSFTNNAESVRIELTWVLSQPQLSKPVHYLSVNSPYFYVINCIATISACCVTHFIVLHSIEQIAISQYDLRRERESNPWTFYSQLFSRQRPRPTGLSPFVFPVAIRSPWLRILYVLRRLYLRIRWDPNSFPLA